MVVTTSKYRRPSSRMRPTWRRSHVAGNAVMRSGRDEAERRSTVIMRRRDRLGRGVVRRKRENRGRARNGDHGKEDPAGARKGAEEYGDGGGGEDRGKAAG